MSLPSLSEGTSVATALELRCSAACVWGVGPPCSGGLSGAGQPLAFARATRRLGGGWRALLPVGRGVGGEVRRRLRELCAEFPDRACALSRSFCASAWASVALGFGCLSLHCPVAALCVAWVALYAASLPDPVQRGPPPTRRAPISYLMHGGTTELHGGTTELGSL